MALVFHRNMPVHPRQAVQILRFQAFRGGRTGDDGGLGPAAGLMAAALLLASLLLSAAVASLPLPASSPGRPSPRRQPTTRRRPGRIRDPKPLPRAVRRSSRKSRLPSRSGYLIPIR